MLLGFSLSSIQTQKNEFVPTFPSLSCFSLTWTNKESTVHIDSKLIIIIGMCQLNLNRTNIPALDFGVFKICYAFLLLKTLT